MGGLGAQPQSGAILVIKIIWVGAVLALGVWYLVTNWEDLVGYAKSVGLWAVVASFAILTIGRVLLAGISRSALNLFGSEISLSRSFYINSLSQIGKYIPGGVWHLAGRITLYRREGTTTRTGAAVLAVENGVLLASGACLGVGLSIGSLLGLTGLPLPSDGLVALSAVGGVIAWWIVVSQVIGRLVRRFASGAQINKVGLFVYGMAFWTAFGTAFWLLLPSDDRNIAALPIAAGTIALAWIVGYVSPFAPAGIGVREGIIIALLGPFLGVPTAAATAAGSRIVWTIQESIVAPLAAAKLAASHNAPTYIGNTRQSHESKES